MLWTIVGALLIVFVGLPILLGIMSSKWFWIFIGIPVGFGIIMFIILISVQLNSPTQPTSQVRPLDPNVGCENAEYRTAEGGC